MKFITTTAIGLVAAVSAAPAAAQYGPAPAAQQTPTTSQAAPSAAQGPIKLSKKASKAIIDLQTAVKANDAANIPAKVAAAKAVAETKEDRYAIGKLQLDAARTAKDDNTAVLAADYIAAANYLPASQVAGLYNSLGVEFFNAKNAPRALTMFQKALAVDPNNAESLRLLAEAQNASGNVGDAVASFQKAMQQAAATGQKLPEDSFKRAVNAAYSSKSPMAVEIGRQWIAAYPSADSWKNAIAIYRNLNHPGVAQTLDLLRLMRAAGALRTGGDYSLYATAAAEQGNFAEAQTVINEGLAAKVVDTSNPLVRDIVNGLKEKPKATAADLAAAAKAATTGTTMIGIGDRYYGIGQYAQAAEMYRLAISKGGDKDRANLHLGMALARAGDKAGALAALNAVTGAQADVAKYWLIYVQRQA